ncbi:MAG TPA: hypothetical protein VFH58_11995 [Acidimicrobiales bacterium]|nr:hypothetical protein [Acidimicrobiales bacterium]
MTDSGFPVLADPEEEVEMETIRVRLEHDFTPAVPVPLIDLVWEEEQERLADASVRRFLPLLAERAARDRLRGLSGAPRH